jgi:hypothetical protein
MIVANEISILQSCDGDLTFYLAAHRGWLDKTLPQPTNDDESLGENQLSLNLRFSLFLKGRATKKLDSSDKNSVQFLPIQRIVS